MPKRAFFCVLPGERASLAEAVQSVGAIPVLDFTCSPTTRVPPGAWVRVRTRRSVPGTGPVILAGSHKVPVRNRETWLEITEPGPAPEGFAGVILRGSEVGGPCGAFSGLDMLAQVGRDQRVILDAGLSPEDAARAFASGAEGVVLSEVLLGLDEIGLPTQMMERLSRLDSGSFHVVNGFQISASPLSPVLRRLLDGEGYWEMASNWFVNGDLSRVAWPVGPGARQAIQFANRYKTLVAVLEAYINVPNATSVPVSRPSSTSEESAGGSEAVAIIGLGCRLPGALSVPEYWDNLLNSRSAIIEVPQERWDWQLFWDQDKSVPDKTYAKIGGFLQGFKFNSRLFRIPPNVAKQVAIVQQITLESVGEALDDAGYGKDREFDRTRVGVILGNSMGGEVTDDYVVRTRVPAFKKALQDLPEFSGLDPETQRAILDGFEAGVKGDLPVINEDSMPGELSNVIAGRVANAFDLCGPNFTVDAACASSMAAVQAAVKALQSGDVDMCVTGGADRSMGVPTYTKFCKIGALSPNHSAPFDQEANGFVMGEGAGVMVLKRLKDAHRDGDRVYAVIKGIGASSDGKGKGITAPNPRGQRLALERAYESAGVDPADVDLIECHGTSTVVGDKVEVESISAVIGEGRRVGRGPIRIGSVKSNIGHLKSAAGAASCIKAALALHNKVFPPSINFNNARSDVPFDTVPLVVQTAAEPWPDGATRRVGVSAFGFGGTNFHVVLEEDRGPGAVTVDAVPRTSRPVLEGQALPASVWGVSAMDRSGLIEALESPDAALFDPSAPVRFAAAASDRAVREEQAARALKVLRKNGSTEMLRGRGIYVEEAPSDGKVAFLFTGQGSQYIDMGLDLAEVYPVVAATFDEADEVMTPELGRPLRDFIKRNPEIPEEQQFERLRDTEISQPATLTVDIAIMRLLAAHGILPDMVAGHSLGEYAAAVAAGILTFRDALVAVSARGREMAGVQIDDKGRMAGIAASVDKVQEVLAEVSGYVVPANKNCSTQTVIAGASEPVEAAIEAFVSRGITVYPLPVSHAFHSSIVAPASKPLKKVLERLDIRAPRRPITTNVTSRYYPDGDDAREEIIDILAQQVAAPVEWIAQVERMYADGARIFVECGPKRALTGFVASILKRRPHRAIYTNHPKRGGLASFQDALASLTTLGFDVAANPGTEVPDIFAEAVPRLATSEAMRKWTAAPVTVEHSPVSHATPFMLRAVLDVVANATGYSPEELNLDDELEADLGIDTVKQAEVVAHVRDRFRLDHDPEFRISQHRTLRDLANYAARRLGSTQPSAIEQVLVDTRGKRNPPAPVGGSTGNARLPHDALASLAEGAARAGLSDGDAEQFAASILPAVQGLVQTMLDARPVREVAAPPPVISAPVSPPDASRGVAQGSTPVVCSGASVGLPGGSEVFAADNIERILDGEVRISVLSEATQDGFLAKRVVRLHKDPQTGQGTFQSVEKREEVIRLAGVKAAFDLEAQYGVDGQWVRALDITTQLAFAAGIEALKDAQIPLVQTFHTTRNGKKVSTGWKLPESMQASTGVIFASAFPGYDKFADHIRNNGADDEGNFDRRFLFQVLAMGHSQFAQYIGARGPNATTNAACASTTQAIGMASDWIRLGRCERVVVVGADDVTSDSMIEWIGTGFLATGAATTKDIVEEAALPFDARRHGMILGMGAAGLVVESEASTADRGVVPLGRLLASRFVNSAFHGTRLNPEHIATEMDALIADAVGQAGVSREDFAGSAMFMSHETYTPAKGGSAAAEIESLRRAFGPAASRVVVTNTKGFTGHPMGAGIEDTVVLKALQYGRVPPIPHLKEPDPDLGNLRLSTGGALPLRFGIRLAAGFGSQLALLAWEGLAHGDHRIGDERKYRSWLERISALTQPTLTEHQRHLRVVEGEASAAVSAPVDASAPSAPSASAKAPVEAGRVLNDLLSVIAEKTGYGLDELETDYELEADLGIDTVKQAEIFGQVREQYGLAPDENFRLADYPTIESLAGWLHAQLGSSPEGSGTVSTPAAGAAAPNPTPAVSATANSAVNALEDLLTVIAEKTGYDVDELETDFELEADLGIDTVKQAEIFGQVREQYGLAPDENFRLADYPTIEALAGWLQAQIDAAGGAPAPQAVKAPIASVPIAAVPESKAPTAQQDPASDPPSGDAVLGDLLTVIAEKTGYDVDELETDFELEADLGIDTVKQAEIFGQVREQYGLAPDENFRLADYPTIESLAGWLQQQVNAGGVAPADKSEPATESPQAEAVEPEPIASSSEPASSVNVLEDLLSVIAEKTGYGVDELETDFELEADLGIDTVKQAEIFGQVREQYGLAPDENFRLADYPTIESLAGWLQAQVDTAVSGVPSAPGAAPPAPAPAESPQEPEAKPRRADAELRLPESFRLRSPIAVDRAPWSMGTIKGRTVHVLGTSAFADAIRAVVASKGGSLDGHPDAVIDAGNRVFDSFSLAQSVASNPPTDWICALRVGSAAANMATARDAGATAGFAKAIGREWAPTSARVVNVDPAVAAETAAALVIEELGADDGSVEIQWTAQGRKAIELKVLEFPEVGSPLTASVVALTGGTRGITAQVAKAFAGRGVAKLALLARTAPGTEPLDEAAAKAAAKERIIASGERATPAAVRDAVAPLKRAEEARQNVEAMRALGAEVEFFTVDLADPDAVRSCMDRVREAMGPIDVLVHGAGVEESRLLQDKDDRAFHRVFDGKAIGGLALAEALEPSAFFVSMGSVAGRFGNPGQVDYSAANEAMAQVCFARPSSLHVDWTAWADVGMAVRGGMDKLLGDRGVEMLPAVPGAELLVDMVATGMTGEVVVAGRLGDFGIAPAHPLLDGVEMNGSSIIGTRDLSLDSDPWLADHAIDGKPVLPGVIGLEMMAAVAAIADPGNRYAGAINVAYNAPIKLHGDASTTVVVTATPGDDGVECSISSTRTARTGRVIETEHFSATVIWGSDVGEDLPPMGMSDHGVSSEAIYARFFHGPIFQVLNRVTAASTDGLLAEGSVRQLEIAGGLQTIPLVLEAAFQAAGLHGMMLDGVMALPRRIASVHVHDAVRDDEPLHLTVRANGSHYDVDVSTERGRLLSLRGFEMVEAGPLPPNGGFEPPSGGWSPAVIARVKSSTSKDDASALLTDAERRVIDQRGNAKRKADRTLGRVAAKRALVQLTGMDPQTFRIENRESGEPYAVTLEGVELPHVSISHRDGEAIAVATSAGRAGVDLERIEARAPSFSETWFRSSERDMCNGDPRRESQVWAIKESVLKALGTGMKLDPRDVEVLVISNGRADVRLFGQASQRHAALGGGELSVDIQDEQSMVIAVTWLAS